MHADHRRTEQPEPLAEELLASPRPDANAGPAFTQYMDGDGATGANTAHGNTGQNQGMRLGEPAPFRGKGKR